MVVNAVYSLDQEELNEKLIGIKKVPGGGLQDSLFVDGVAFKKTVSGPERERACAWSVLTVRYSSPTPVSSSSRRCSTTPRSFA